MLPDLPWFVYAMLLAPLGLLLGAAVYKSLQVRARMAVVTVYYNPLHPDQAVLERDLPKGHVGLPGYRHRDRAGDRVASTSNWLVRKSTTDYQNGASVKVWVNPGNPSEAPLEPRTGFEWVLWLAAAAIWGVAYYAAVHG